MGKYKTKSRPRKAKSVFPVWLIIAGAGIILVAVFAFFNNLGRDKTAVEVTGAPKIKVDQDLFNYGDVKLGLRPVRTVVRVTNVGDQILKFREPPYLEVLEGC